MNYQRKREREREKKRERGERNKIITNREVVIILKDDTTFCQTIPLIDVHVTLHFIRTIMLINPLCSYAQLIKKTSLVKLKNVDFVWGFSLSETHFLFAPCLEDSYVIPLQVTDEKMRVLGKTYFQVMDCFKADKTVVMT